MNTDPEGAADDLRRRKGIPLAPFRIEPRKATVCEWSFQTAHEPIGQTGRRRDDRGVSADQCAHWIKGGVQLMDLKCNNDIVLHAEFSWIFHRANRHRKPFVFLDNLKAGSPDRLQGLASSHN